MRFGAVSINGTHLVWLCTAITLSTLVAALSSCGILGLEQTGEAWVEVDPTLVRTIRYFVDQREEVTELAETDIDCLHTEPQSCSIREEIAATVHNTGPGEVLYHEQCGGALERWTDESWWVDRGVPCITLSTHDIPEGSSRAFTISVYRLAAGRYRIHLLLTKDMVTLPEYMSVSEAFEWP